LVKSRARCRNPGYGHNPDAGYQAVLVQPKDFSEPPSYSIANNGLADSPSCDDSQPRCGLAGPVQNS
jgi:hypothetical protein